MGLMLLARRFSSTVGEDMEPYERSELGGVGEGLRDIDRAHPLTQLRLASKLASLCNPLPKKREIS
jgi:hypothetical protein